MGLAEFGGGGGGVTFDRVVDELLLYLSFFEELVLLSY